MSYIFLLITKIVILNLLFYIFFGQTHPISIVSLQEPCEQLCIAGAGAFLEKASGAPLQPCMDGARDSPKGLSGIAYVCKHC